MFEKYSRKLWSRRIVVAFFALFVSGIFMNVPVFAIDVMQSHTTIPPVPHVADSGASTVTAGTQQGVDVVLADLQANTKLHSPGTILADFVDGKTETAVIILLQPTAAAKVLAADSKVSAQVPAEFAVAGAPTYYNLQDESVRTQLQATVTETVGRVIDQLGATGITVTQRFTYQFGFAARVTPEALERIVNSPEVLTVEKDGILYPHLAQGIPLMNATTPRSTYSGSGVSIAICDTGIDTSHPRLGGGGFPNSKVIGGYNTGDGNADPRPNSVSGATHGTECAGIAAGNTGTVGDYIGGVAPNAKLYAIKISTGTTGSAATSAMIAGWEWAVTHKNDDPNNPIMIISTSFGGNRFTSTCDAESSGMTTAAANAVAAGITIFASSGNDGYCDSMGWPACISYVNSVGAVYDANFGSYTPCVDVNSCAAKIATGGCATGWYVNEPTNPDKVTAYSNSVSFLTLFAPSNMAYTTTIVNRGNAPDNDYATDFGGTSAACPYAAGAAAVLQQAAKAKTGSFLTPAQVKTYLVNNGNPITDSKVAVTKPRINLGNAVNALPSSGGDGQIGVTNGSSKYTITALYVALSSSSTWGPNQIPSAIPAGGLFTLTGVPPGSYDLMAVFSNRTNYTTFSFTVTGGTTTQITARPTGQIKVTNGSSYYSITEMYIASSSSATWGPNQLPATVPTRGSITFINLPEGAYDIKVVFSNGTTATGYGFTVVTRRTTNVKATTPDPGKIKVINRSTIYSITELYISLSSSPTWGPNQLPYSISPRKSITYINVPAGTYDLMAVYSNGSIATTTYPFTVAPRKTFTINVYDH